VSAHAITLITLVITIVILIILASVAINLALNDNSGLISKTKKANEATIIANEKEQIQLAYLTVVSEDYEKEITTETLKNQIESYTKLDTIVEKQKLYYDSLNEKYYLYYIDEEVNYSEKDLQNVYELKNEDYSNVTLEDFFIVFFPEKNRWYRLNEKGMVNSFLPLSEVCRMETYSINSKDAFRAYSFYYMPSGCSRVELGLVYATNKALGYSGQASSRLEMSIVNEKLIIGSKYKFSNTETSVHTTASYRLGMALPNRTVVVYVRPYMIIKNNTTGDTTTIYGDVVPFTYNQIAQLEAQQATDE
jgi:hypothetical protein